MELFLDPNDGRPMSVQLYEQLRSAIVEGQLAPGDRLGATRSVAADLRVSRSTVTDAYSRLVAEGYAEGRAGGGSVVSAVPRPVRRRRPASALAPTARAAAVTRYDQHPGAAGRFDLRPGSVDRSLFPTTVWRRCLARPLDHPPQQYGDPAGSPALREALAGWVTRSRGVAARPAEIIVTSGAGHAVDLVTRVLVDPGSVVAVEEPGYPPVVALLRSHGLRVVGVPVDQHGIVVDAIPSRARLVYVTPSHQYPLGPVLARSRRLELLHWASRAGAAILEDDYDSELRRTARPLEPLQRLDSDGRVIYVGTFSKSLSPALRLGFLVAPPSLIPALCAIRQVIDWCPPEVTQSGLEALITAGHLDRHLRRARIAYAERFQRMSSALRDMLPTGFQILPSRAGLHITLVNPDLPPDDLLHAAADRRNTRITSLRTSYHFTEPTSGLIVGFGGIATPDVPMAVAELSATIADASS
jgi:GntR family transcriptional regulator/MocR family aminotransferase